MQVNFTPTLSIRDDIQNTCRRNDSCFLRSFSALLHCQLQQQANVKLCARQAWPYAFHHFPRHKLIIAYYC